MVVDCFACYKFLKIRKEFIVSEETQKQDNSVFVANKVEEIKQMFSDGFQWADLITSIRIIMESVELLSGLGGQEKHELAMEIVKKVVKETDTPYLPDGLTDPILIALAEPIMENLAKAAKGMFGINKSSE